MYYLFIGAIAIVTRSGFILTLWQYTKVPYIYRKKNIDVNAVNVCS